MQAKCLTSARPRQGRPTVLLFRAPYSDILRHRLTDRRSRRRPVVVGRKRLERSRLAENQIGVRRARIGRASRCHYTEEHHSHLLFIPLSLSTMPAALTTPSSTPRSASFSTDSAGNYTTSVDATEISRTFRAELGVS